jgi:prolipoprotein diacylglyceryltransferase
LTMGEILSFVMIVVGAILFYVRRRS